jgi:hypothetical protein
MLIFWDGWSRNQILPSSRMNASGKSVHGVKGPKSIINHSTRKMP